MAPPWFHLDSDSPLQLIPMPVATLRLAASERWLILLKSVQHASGLFHEGRDPMCSLMLLGAGPYHELR
jgi:hypothetical protein